MPPVLLENMKQDPVQRWPRAIVSKPAAGSADRRQVCGLDYRPGPLATLEQRGDQLVDGLFRADVPRLVREIVTVVAPWCLDRFRGKAPSEPAALHED
jgi:hypothetical protein